MHISQHADQRMNQRGISRRLVDFTVVEGDDTLITAYNVSAPARRRSGGPCHV